MSGISQTGTSSTSGMGGSSFWGGGGRGKVIGASAGDAGEAYGSGGGGGLYYQNGGVGKSGVIMVEEFF